MRDVFEFMQCNVYKSKLNLLVAYLEPCLLIGELKPWLVHVSSAPCSTCVLGLPSHPVSLQEYMQSPAQDGARIPHCLKFELHRGQRFAKLSKLHASLQPLPSGTPEYCADDAEILCVALPLFLAVSSAAVLAIAAYFWYLRLLCTLNARHQHILA